MDRLLKRGYKASWIRHMFHKHAHEIHFGVRKTLISKIGEKPEDAVSEYANIPVEFHKCVTLP